MKNKEHIESFDEIVFEKRNKDYGAYFLRSIYKKHMTFAVTVSSLALLLFMSVPLVKAYYDQGNARNKVRETSVVSKLEKIRRDEDAPPPPPPPPPPPEAVEQKAAFKAPIVTTDTTEATSDLPDQDELSKTAPVAPPKEVVIDEGPKEEVKVIQQVEDVTEYVSVEEMPEFPGGEAELQKYIATNIKYPQIAKESGIQGTVYVKFVVNEQGVVFKADILRGIGGGCDEEAIRIIKSLPKWTSGKQNGKAVKVTFTVPIRFILQ